MEKSIRYSLPILAISILIGCGQEQKKKGNPYSKTENMEQITETYTELLIGTFTSGMSKGIYKVDFNTKTGELQNTRLLIEKENPGYIHISKDRSKVYSSNSGKPGSISIYEFNDDRTQLNLIGDHSSEGDGACYIALNSTESLVAAANYGSGSIVVYQIDQAGKVIGGGQNKLHSGSGPHPNQKSPHAHCVKFGDSGKFLYAVDLGIDEIVSYEVTPDGILGKSHTALKTGPGDGPRHLIFHPTKDMAFIVNELSSSVISATVDSEKGSLERIDKQSTLPADFVGNNACADIHLSADGRFLYASNRGHNSIAIFSVSEEGKLKLLDTEPVQGDWPRNFTLSPNGKFLLVANERSNNISVFKVNRATGRLSFTGNQIELSQPVCLKF